MVDREIVKNNIKIYKCKDFLYFMEIYSEDYKGFLNPVDHPYSFHHFINLMYKLPGSICVTIARKSSVYDKRPQDWPESAIDFGIWNCDGVTVFYEDRKYLTGPNKELLGHLSITLVGSDDAVVDGVERKILDSIETLKKAS